METTLELLLLILAIWPLLRLRGCHGFRQTMRAFPGTQLAFDLGLALYAVAITSLAYYFPTALRYYTLFAYFVVLVGWCRARPQYGRRRRLPPGSLKIVPTAPWQNERFFQEQAAAHGPIFKTNYFVAPTVCVVGLNHIHSMLRQHERNLSVPALPFSRLIPGNFLRNMGPADHQRYSAAFRAALSTELVAQCAPFMARNVRAEFDCLATSSRAAGSAGIAPRPVFERIVFACFARLFYGITPESPSFCRLRDLYADINFRRLVFINRGKFQNTLDAITDILQDQAHRIHGHVLPLGPAHAEASLLENLLRRDPAALNDKTLLGNLIFLFQFSANDVSGLLHWLLRFLSDHPDWRQSVREGIALGPNDSSSVRVADCIVWETLRLEQSEYIVRRALCDLEYGRFRIPRGWFIRFCIRESHRSAEMFDDPERFNPGRFLADDRLFSKSTFCPFGPAKFSCLGKELTRTLCRIFVQELSTGFDWEVTSDGPREARGFHWAPSSAMRIKVVARAAHAPRRRLAG